MHRIVAPTLAVAAVLAVAAGNVPAGTPSGEPAISTVTFTAAERRETLAYWTADRMRDVGAAELGHDAASVRPWRGPAMKTVGRLFFTNEKGQDTYCTATAVRSGNRSTVMTAGHCVQLPASPDNHYSNMVFAPGYGDGERPYGVFAVRAVAMPRSWAQDARNDVAAVVVDQGDEALTDAVGAQAVAFDRKPGGAVTVFGYPDSQEQRGEHLMYCAGTTSATPDGKQSVRCPMEGGSSGGPWLAGFDRKSGRGTLVSVNSFGDAAENGTAMEGEVLGAVADQVLARAEKL
ncbi:trypsin-like peptidase domain-containing protein [Streptomyces ferrugineus]|uniref:Trypsin-like peptidase domain-containing protein n=1 Tax=Streptomyces ferrugineus TaxID=1413221 RepID=A0A7M2SR10_9ACTN|nr:trypsin-like peptidase domain-containing protein [Streptomyces ferrugineus]QOV37918.1 trypsin-like peptidase domain-containing protein [Streptomyces ferrugineus]